MMSAAEVIIPRKIWTRADTRNLPGHVFSSLELVNGELLDKTLGKRPPHVYWKMALHQWLIAQFGFDYVRAEDPIDVAPEDNPVNEPEPDLAVTDRPYQETEGANPAPENLRLVVEISDSTYAYDKVVKAALYARAGIREFWLLDIRLKNAPRLLIHQKPANGSYESIQEFTNLSNLEVLDGRNLDIR